MQRARLDRLKAAWKTVTDILGELDGDETDKAADKVAAPAPAPAPAPIVIVDTVKADANAAEIKRLSTMVETLQKMVKEQGVELAKSKQPVDSNTISLEKSKFDHDKVIWDNDMASHSARVRGRSL
jgi:agmatine/peptidylarginine deiminase